MPTKKKTILLTGAAGFIGFHTAKRLLKEGKRVIGVDNLNEYYDPTLKQARLSILQKEKNFDFHKVDISDLKQMEEIFQNNDIHTVCHLAAQAGVRYSLENPFAYERSNMLGTLTILELMKRNDVQNIVYASSSSVYGGKKTFPVHEKMPINKPISLYAATKAANELQAHVYHHLFGINAVGLRFFTVYGPWGRPDMALFIFAKAMSEGKPIDVFNKGDMVRDFTYVDDIVDGVCASIDRVDTLGYEIFNLGCSTPVPLMDFIREIENALGVKAEKKMKPMQPGDIKKSYASVDKAKKMLDYKPRTQVKEGVKKFIMWYTDYYGTTTHDSSRRPGVRGPSSGSRTGK